jgi:hypothetical protein
MKLAAVFLMLASISVFGQSPTSAHFNWTYSYNAAYPVPCDSAVTNNCIESFVLTQGGVTVATIHATTATNYSYVLSPLPAPGTYTYTLVAVGAYQGGTIQSAPVTVSLQVPAQPDAPGSFTVVLQ